MKVLNKFICLLPIFLFFFTLVGCDTTNDAGKNQEEFEVKFLVDGEVISSEKVKCGESATEVAVPSKEGYNFVGWDKEFTNVKSDLEINAIYEVKTFEVKFFIDEVLFETKKVEYGKNVEIDNPIKEGYKFVGWDKDITNIKSDLSVKALFEVEIFEIKFFVDGTLYETKQVEYGESVEIDNPTKEGYKFVSWDKELNNLVENLEINAIFEEMLVEKEMINSKVKVLEEYFNRLSYPLKNGRIELIDYLEEVSIKWNSSDEKIIALDGSVTQPYVSEKQKEVVLKAVLEYNDCKLSFSFNVNVKRGYKDLSKGINAIYNYNNEKVLSDTALTTYDIVYFAFLGLAQDGSGKLTNSGAVVAKINKYKDDLHAQGGRALVSLQASGSSQINNIMKVITNDESLDNLVNNLLNLCIENDLDGVDIDWEWPDQGTGELAYTKMMKKIYETFKAYDENLLVTSAMSGGPFQVAKYNLKNSAQYHDYINLMIYDLQTDGRVSFHNALFPKTNATNSGHTVSESVELFNTYGVKNSQIIIGVPFYGRVIKGSITLWGNGTWSVAAINQTTINSYISGGKYTSVYDEDCQVPYLFSESKKEFVSYENNTSISNKWKYISENNLAGMMAWRYGQDDNDKLTKAMRSGKSRYM